MARFTQDESPIVKLAAAEGITVEEYIERQEVIDHGIKETVFKTNWMKKV